MAKIVDPDSLNQGTEVTLATGAKTITLSEAGNLSSDGVTIKALYSFLKEEWRNDAALPAYPFPFVPITDESFELVDGWDFANDASRYLIRDGGWTVKDTAGNTTQKWAGIIGLGDIESDDQVYFDNGPGKTNFQLTGQVNQAIQIIDDPNGDGNFVDGFDRSATFNLYVREQGQLYDSSNLSAIGVTTMDSIAYRFPISTGTDLKITTADTGIDANSDGTADVAPYTAMDITYIDHTNRGAWADATVYNANDVVQSAGGRWFITTAGGTSSGNDTDLAGGSDTGVTWAAYTGERQIGSNWYAFGVIVDGNNGTAEQIYEFCQWSLRQSVDIDAGAGTVTGNIADELVEFIGDTLRTLRQSNNHGVYIDNFQSADTNRLEFTDDTGTIRTFPFVAVITLQFSATLQNDTNAKYWVSFSDATATPANGDEWDSAGAILVDDNSVVDMTGNVSGSASIQHDFDYDGNTQGGRTPATDANVTVVALGLDGAQYVRATGTIERSTTNVVSLVAPLERNYDNP